MRIGNVPQEWYDEYDHIGYSADGSQIQKLASEDKISEFISKAENKNWWRTITDDLQNKKVTLSDSDIKLLQSIRTNSYYSENASTELEEFPEFTYNSPFAINNSQYLPKRNFIRSAHERKIVNRLVHSIKMGWLKLAKSDESEEKERIWDIWNDETIQSNKPKKMPKSIHAPKRDLPTHAESYNPSQEYLFDQDELTQWNDQDESERPLNFIPKIHDSLRKVPLYKDAITQEFERCIELYLCPRIIKKKIHVDPNSLIPQIPDPSTLKPFPTKQSLLYQGNKVILNFIPSLSKGHETRVLTLSVHPNGHYLASGDKAGRVIIWDVNTTFSMIQ